MEDKTFEEELEEYKAAFITLKKLEKQLRNYKEIIEGRECYSNADVKNKLNAIVKDVSNNRKASVKITKNVIEFRLPKVFDKKEEENE